MAMVMMGGGDGVGDMTVMHGPGDLLLRRRRSSSPCHLGQHQIRGVGRRRSFREKDELFCVFLHVGTGYEEFEIVQEEELKFELVEFMKG
jgi:hypothetical protein